MVHIQQPIYKIFKLHHEEYFSHLQAECSYTGETHSNSSSDKLQQHKPHPTNNIKTYMYHNSKIDFVLQSYLWLRHSTATDFREVKASHATSKPCLLDAGKASLACTCTRDCCITRFIHLYSTSPSTQFKHGIGLHRGLKGCGSALC